MLSLATDTTLSHHDGRQSFQEEEENCSEEQNCFRMLFYFSVVKQKSRDEKLAYSDPAWQILCMLAFDILLPDFYIS